MIPKTFFHSFSAVSFIVCPCHYMSLSMLLICDIIIKKVFLKHIMYIDIKVCLDRCLIRC